MRWDTRHVLRRYLIEEREGCRGGERGGGGEEIRGGCLEWRREREKEGGIEAGRISRKRGVVGGRGGAKR